jgi:hypothetical protein
MLKLQLNWGQKIAIVYSSFVCFMLFLVFLTANQKHELVTGDYYAKELRFQEELDIKQQTKALGQQPGWKVGSTSVTFTFPMALSAKGVSADIVLYKASDSRMDRAFHVSVPATGVYVLPSSQIGAGRYKLILSWQAGGKKYINEGNINLL